LEQASLRTINAVVRLAVSWPVPSNLQLVAYERGLQLAADRGKDDPHTAAAVLETIRGVASDPPEFARRWRSLLEGWRAAHSEDLELVCALAFACEYQGDSAACEKLLVPHVARLGSSDGARILGQVLVLNGEFDKAHDLLSAYSAAHLKRAQ